MKTVHVIAALAVFSTLSGCASNRFCSQPLSYENSPSIPPLTGTDTLKIPTTSTALKVPDSKGDSLTFGYVTPDPARPGKTKVTCLDQPPPIPPIADASK